MRRRWIIIPLLCVLLAGALAYVFTRTPFSVYVYGYGEGCPEYAHRWSEAFTDIPDPEMAQRMYPEVFLKRFNNGEWVFGVCSDSHSSHRGGTIVLKESTGQVRAFFGHVCGSLFPEYNLLAKSESLEELYRCGAWQQNRFREYKLP